MAGASDPLEDMLFSEVDEKAVSDLVGSLESQLVGQSDPAIAPPENTHPGCENTHPSSAKQQQQQTGGKAQLPARVDTPSEPQQQQPPQQQHGRKAAGKPDSDPKKPGGDARAKAEDKESTLKSHVNTIAITTTAASSDGVPAPVQGNKGEIPRDTRKKHPGSFRAQRSAASHSLNGNGVSAASASSSGSVSPPPSSGPAVTPNSTIFTVSSNPQAIALDRGTPTIALQRLPRHIIASIAQNGNGTSVSALVQQGAQIAATGAQVNHSKPADAPGNNAKPAVNSVSPATPTAPVKPTVSAPPMTPLIRPAQTQPRPAPPAQQKIVTPQLIVRPPQQQTTIQLPPGFSIPPGKNLFNY